MFQKEEWYEGGVSQRDSREVPSFLKTDRNTGFKTDPTRDSEHNSASKHSNDSKHGELSKLATMHEKSLVGEKCLAEALDVSDRTIRAMIKRDDLPPPIQIAGRSFWFAGKVIEFFAQKAEAAAEAQARRVARLNRR